MTVAAAQQSVSQKSSDYCHGYGQVTAGHTSPDCMLGEAARNLELPRASA